jgi:SAM-dependent methyltransferase
MPENVIIPRLSLDLLYNVYTGKTPIRAISDLAIKYHLNFLLGEGTIYELGASSDYYKKFVPPKQKYQITDLSPHSPMPVDMTAMPFADNSVDAFFSAFALEHVKDYQKAIAEMKRTLKPGGRLLLVVPFLYYYHGAPSDYVRFTGSYLNELFVDMKIYAMHPLGTRGLCIAEFFDERSFTPVDSSRLARFFYKILTMLLVAGYSIRPKQMPGFASAYLMLAEKTGERPCSESKPE